MAAPASQPASQQASFDGAVLWLSKPQGSSSSPNQRGAQHNNYKTQPTPQILHSGRVVLCAS